MLARDGRVVWIRDTARMLRDESGQPNLIHGIMLDITAGRQAEEAQRESEEKYRQLVELAPDGVLIHVDGEIVFANSAGAKILGAAAPKDLIGKPILSFVHSDFQKIVKDRIEKLTENEQEVPLIEEKHVRLDGTVIDTEVKAIPFRYKNKNAVQLVINDITERKLVEAALARRAEELATLQTTVLEITGSHDLPSLLQTIVERATHLLGADGGGLYLCDPEQQEVRCVVSYNTIKDYADTVLKYGEGAAGQVAQSGKPLIIDDYRTWSGRAEIYKKDQPFRALVSVPMLWKGQVTGVLHALRTGQDNPFTQADLDFLFLFANHAAIAVENTRLVDGLRLELKERKQVEMELEFQKEFAFQVMNTMGQGLTVTDAEGNFEYVNSTYARMLGYSPQQLMGRNPLEFTTLEDQAAQAQIWIQRARGETTTYEAYLQRADGTAFPVSITGVPRFQDGKFIGSIAVVTDLTERVQAEAGLKRRVDELSTIYHSALAMQSMYSLNELAPEIISILEEGLKYEHSAVLLIEDNSDRLIPYGISGQKHDPKFTEVDRAFIQSFDIRIGQGIVGWVAQTGKSVRLGDVRKDSRYFQIREAICSEMCVPLMAGNQIIGVVNIESTQPDAYSEADQRVLETVAAQIAASIRNGRLFEELRRSEASLEEAQRIAHLGSWEWDSATDTPTWSKELCAILEVDPNQPAPSVAEQDKLYTSESMKKMHAGIEQAMGGRPYEIELERVWEDGRRKWLLARGEPRFDKNGQITGLRGTALDITERVQAEEKLRASNERFLGIYQNMTIGLYRTTPNGQIQLANPSLVRMLGFDSFEELSQRNLETEGYEAGFERSEFKNLIESQGEIHGYESAWTTKDGSTIYCRESAKAFRDTSGKVIYYEGTVEDITERRHAQDALEQKARELQTLYESAMTISSSLALEEVLNTVVEQTIKAINTDGCTISLLDPKRNALVTMVDYRKTFSDVMDTPGNTYFLVDYPVTNRALETHQPSVLYWNDPQIDSRELALMERMDIGTLLLMPLVARDRVIGLMELYEVDNKERVFTKDEVRLAQSLSVQTAIFIENARLFEQAELRLQRTEALHKIDIAIAGSMDVNAIFNVIFDQAFAQLGMDAIVILLFDPITQVLEYAAGRGFHTQALQETRLPLGQGYAGRAALGRQIIHISKLQTRTTDFLRSPTFSQEGFVSYYGVPLIAKGEIKGVLEIFHRQAFEAETEWLDFLESLAGQMAIAIDNATLFKDLQLSNIELTMAYDATIEGWSHAMDLRDRETQDHTLRVTAMAERLARAMGIGDADLVHIRRGGLLHDIGKMGVPDSVLLKPGKLTDEEWVLMRQHPQFAHDMLAPIPYLRPAMDIPYCHHEKWDGTGYPRGLQGEQIPLAARIFTVVDVYDALTSDRPYRKAWSKKKTLEYIREQSGTHFDPAVADAFLTSEVIVPKKKKKT